MRPLFAIALFIFIAYLARERRGRFPTRLVVNALLFEALLTQLLMLPYLELPLRAIAVAGQTIMSFAADGIKIVFGHLATPSDPDLNIFAVNVLPVVVYFSALTSLAFYLGIVQRCSRLTARIMRAFFGSDLSGPEAMVASANLFVGQVEAPLCVSSQISGMSRTQIMTMMVCGFATMSASVGVVYATILSSNDAGAASTYLAIIMKATILAIPAAILLARIMVPSGSDDHPIALPPSDDMDMEISPFDSIVRGARQGVLLAFNIGAMLVVFGALLALVNYLLNAPGRIGCNLGAHSLCDYAHLKIEKIFGGCLAPIAYIVGFGWADAKVVGSLLGTELMATEFYAFSGLAQSRFEISREGFVLAIFAISSFANFASIGVQVGGLSSIRLDRRSDFVQLAPRAMLAGFLASMIATAFASLSGMAR